MTYSMTSTAPVLKTIAKPTTTTTTTTAAVGNGDAARQSAAKRMSHSSAANAEETGRRCEWGTCTREFENAELLYTHVCDDHIGRKIKQNLNLSCGWPGCNVQAQKRDHITSHVRVHIPFKPYRCGRCAKTFKRPQDLRKHTKIHADDAERAQGTSQTETSPTGSGHGAMNGHAAHNHLESLAATTPSYFMNPLSTAPAPQPTYVPTSTAAGFNNYGAPYTPLLYPGLGQTMPGLTESRKRELDTMDDLFRAIKRREVNPASYPQVAEALAGLHGVDLSLPVNMAVPASNAASFQAGAQPPQPQPLAMPPMSLGLPPLANLMTKKDLLHAEHWLEQSHATAYEEALQASTTTQAAGQPNLYAAHLGSPPEVTAAHSPAPSLTSHASSSSASHGTPPGMHPAVPVSLPAALSPGSFKLDSSSGLSPVPVTYSPPGSSYPRLPTASFAGDVSAGYAPVASIKATAGFDALFGADPRRHYSGGMLQRSARPDPAAAALPKPVERSSRSAVADEAESENSDNDDADTAKATKTGAVSTSVIDPRLHSSSDEDEPAKGPVEETSPAPLSSKELFIIERLQQLVLDRLQRNEYDDDEDDGSDDGTVDEDPDRIAHDDEAPAAATMESKADKGSGVPRAMRIEIQGPRGEVADAVDANGGLSYPRLASLKTVDEAH